MKGIELSRQYYEQYGKPMLSSQFSDKLDRIAVGLVGHGSECFGFDDEISTDHDFAPGFCIWISDDDDRDFGFRLMRAYSKLPKEFEGIKHKDTSIFGNDGKGVMTVSDFYRRYTGRVGAPECWQDWLYTPSHYFAEATNGAVFSDPLGEFSRIRDEIANGMPEDVRLKKIASCAFKMAQSGQYNYLRCLKHGERGAARFALNEFATECSNIIFLLERKHAPYYKWIFRAMNSLETLNSFADKLEALLTLHSEDHSAINDSIEEISAEIIVILKEQGLSCAVGDYLEHHAYSVNDRIKDHNIRNLSIII